MGFSRDSLDRVRRALDPLEVFREAVPSLKPAGARWRGLCPFHNERTPSFYFLPEKGLWHCFGACNDGGDVFKFVMRTENLSFPESVRRLADRAGVRVEWEGESPAQARAAKERDDVLELLEKAAVHYYQALQSGAEGEAARRYLAERGVEPRSIERFRLGHAAEREGFLDGALRRGEPIELLLKAGLAVRSAGGRYHDPLRGRVIFPILDAYGRVVAFGGRTLGADVQGPKYLNSPETPVYTKGRHLYGLYAGREALRDRRQALLVEGYMDVVACHQAGVASAVAPLGTALTQDQAKLLKRYVQEVVLLYDPDDAGVKASWRSAAVLLAEDLFARVASLPDGEDPDVFLRREGAGPLEKILDASRDVVDFWLDRIAAVPEHFSGLHGRVRQAQELLGFLRGVPNELLRREWLRKAAKRLALDEGALSRQLGGRPPAPPLPPPAPPRPPQRPAQRPAVRSAEEEVLQLLCAHPETRGGVELGTELFGEPRCRALFDGLERQRASGAPPDPAALGGETGVDEAWLSALLMEEKHFPDPPGALRRGVERLKRSADGREFGVLGREVAAMLDGRCPRDEQKIMRYQRLTRVLKGAEGSLVKEGRE